jgi:hypothetical protein
MICELIKVLGFYNFPVSVFKRPMTYQQSNRKAVGNELTFPRILGAPLMRSVKVSGKPTDGHVQEARTTVVPLKCAQK